MVIKNMHSKFRVAMQAFDREILDKDQLSKVTKINFKTAEMDAEAWNGICTPESQANFLMDILDRGLITKQAAAKQIFDIDI